MDTTVKLCISWLSGFEIRSSIICYDTFLENGRKSETKKRLHFRSFVPYAPWPMFVLLDWFVGAIRLAETFETFRTFNFHPSTRPSVRPSTRPTPIFPEFKDKLWHCRQTIHTFSESPWCQLSKFGQKFKYRDKDKQQTTNNNNKHQTTTNDKRPTTKNDKKTNDKWQTTNDKQQLTNKNDKQQTVTNNKQQQTTNNHKWQTMTNDKYQTKTDDSKTYFWMHIMKADHLDTWTTWTTLTNWTTLTILTDQYD